MQRLALERGSVDAIWLAHRALIQDNGTVNRAHRIRVKLKPSVSFLRNFTIVNGGTRIPKELS